MLQYWIDRIVLLNKKQNDGLNEINIDSSMDIHIDDLAPEVTRNVPEDVNVW